MEGVGGFWVEEDQHIMRYEITSASLEYKDCDEAFNIKKDRLQFLFRIGWRFSFLFITGGSGDDVTLMCVYIYQ